MKLVKIGKTMVAGLCIAATLAGAALPTMALSPAGYTSLAQIEEMNDADPAKVQAIKDALANVKIVHDSQNDSWELSSNYEDYEIDSRFNYVMPWLDVSNGYNNVSFGLLLMSQDNEGFYYWTKADILTDSIESSKFTLSYESSKVSRTYSQEDKNYTEILAFVGNDDTINNLRELLSHETIYMRFNGNQVNNHRRTVTSLMNQENKQGITDIINLYDLLNSATPEERAAALNG